MKKEVMLRYEKKSVAETNYLKKWSKMISRSYSCAKDVMQDLNQLHQ